MRDSTAMDARGAMRKRELPDVLKHPGGFLVDLKRDREIPWGFWMQCAAIAVLGSLLFGFSLVRILPGLDAAGSGLWFTLSAGAAWVVFGPLLRVGTGLPWRVLAQACLVTMVFGEIVLMAGAVFQMGLGAKLEEGRWALWSAVFWVGLPIWPWFRPWRSSWPR